MAVGDTIPGCTGTGTQVDPYIFEDFTGFLNAIDVVDAYIEAKNNNMTFDFNNLSYTLPMTIKCRSMKAKGLTLLNIIAQNGTYDIMKFEEVSTLSQSIDNLNIYNFCIIVNSNNGGSCHLIKCNGYVNSSYAIGIRWTNCNFAGCVIGHSTTSYNPTDTSTLIGYTYNGSNFNAKYSTFENCTFNIHLKDTFASLNSFTLAGSGGYQPPTTFTNCSICISGNVPYKCIYINGVKTSFNNVTFINSASNPLRCYLFSCALDNLSASGYNYYKAYITAVSGIDGKSIYFNDTMGLVNRTRLVPYNNLFSSNGIVMQEYNQSDPDQFLLDTEPGDWSTNWTNYFTKSGNVYTHVTGAVAPTFTTNTYYNVPSDYIYLDENLSNAGFLVGEVIQ